MDQPWFDQEYKDFRKRLHKALRRFRSSLSNDDWFVFCTVRQYENLLHCKKRRFKALMVDKLVHSVGNQQEFWTTISVFVALS